MFLQAAILLVAASFSDAQDSHAGNHTDGYWISWMGWTTCSVTCGTGYHVRSRLCHLPEAVGKGKNCTGSDFDTKPCDEINCPVDGAWNSWSAWRGCTTTCGTGVTWRLRKCDNPKPAYNGTDCMGSSQDFSKCALNPCPVDGGWTNWGDWASCSVTCGYDIYRPRYGNRTGQHTLWGQCTMQNERSCFQSLCSQACNCWLYYSQPQRKVCIGYNVEYFINGYRNCSNPEPAFGGSDCLGDKIDEQLCEYVDCKDGVWNEWAPWGDCSATCGTSVHFRFRNCSFSAMNGSCLGDEYESGLCSSFCPVDGEWSDWQGWATCSATCENGTTTRSRQCANPPQAHGGRPCIGNNTDIMGCTDPTPCPIDGGWSGWTNWTNCDQTCGSGNQLRIRRCSNPPPMYNGQACAGKDIETRSCSDTPCPQNGVWASWFMWSGCSITCGNGVKTRFRTCSNPKPEFGGAFCDGEFEELTNCTISPDITNCTIDGGWSSWNSWSSCGVSCGMGVVTRTRECTNPTPHGEGKFCSGAMNDTNSCTADQPCPVNGEWSSWRDWFPCTATCGNGTETRFRICSNPKPQHGGRYCQGNTDQTQDCFSGTTCTDGSDISFVG